MQNENFKTEAIIAIKKASGKITEIYHVYAIIRAKNRQK